MTRGRLLAFIDCNILIAGMFVPMHPARAVMVLASNKHLDLITCREVIEDIEDEILERAKIHNDLQEISWGYASPGRHTGLGLSARGRA